MIKKYKAPRILSKKLRLNYFFNNRAKDSFSLFLDGSQLAQAIDPDNDCGCGASCCCGGCFLANTYIRMADGTSKRIQQVKAGDFVLSYDIFSKTFIKNAVKKLFVHPDMAKEYYKINKRVMVTGNHRIWTNNDAWERVDMLDVGDRVTDNEGRNIVVEHIEKKTATKPLTIYNLDLKGKEHNYLAGNYVVHNGPPK